jgi:hypothetical protein
MKSIRSRWAILLVSLVFAPLSAFASGQGTPNSCDKDCEQAKAAEHPSSCSQDYCTKSDESESDYGCGSWETTKNFGASALSGSSANGAQLFGVGTYLRFHGSRLGVEASIDSSTIVEDQRVAGRFSGGGALMLYVNSSGFIRGYGVLGRGVTEVVFGPSSTRSHTKQLGGGLEVDISKKFALNADLRRVQDEEISGDVSAARILVLPTEFTVGSFGLNLRF